MLLPAAASIIKYYSRSLMSWRMKLKLRWGKKFRGWSKSWSKVVIIQIWINSNKCIRTVHLYKQLVNRESVHSSNLPLWNNLMEVLLSLEPCTRLPPHLNLLDWQILVAYLKQIIYNSKLVHHNLWMLPNKMIKPLQISWKWWMTYPILTSFRRKKWLKHSKDLKFKIG